MSNLLVDLEQFKKNINTSKQPIPAFKKILKQAREKSYELFQNNYPVDRIIESNARFIDHVLIAAWQKYVSEKVIADIALIAVGGYGRNELHPHSDIDILILFKEDNVNEYESELSSFITFLWDIGLEIGSSVRTLTECIEASTNDITIATNIIESRLIWGENDLFDALSNSTGPDNIWPSKDFFQEKWREQIQRHLRFNDTAYNLEPNIKEGPGGLRDLQMIGWVTKRHFGDRTLKDLAKRGFLTETELSDLLKDQLYLWKVRFALHMHTDRREDRLLFEHQRTIAKMLGFKDQSAKKTTGENPHMHRASDGARLDVELFMKTYYNTVMDLSRLNEILLQDYEETILYSDDHSPPIRINSRFQVNRGFIEISEENIFQKYPFALLEIFLLKQQNKTIKGVRASTIRSIRQHLPLINDTFRNDIRCKSLFIEIFKQSEGLTHVLRRMNTYGVLAAYIPSFGEIAGQMQFDLFHIYTVDQHTLFVIRNLRRFFVNEYAHEFPLCSDIIRSIPKPELLYLAGLFHDIAKGRGGDHSVLGKEDAVKFCEQHGLSQRDSHLVGWLVQHHLLMSSTAQNKDISDHDVIHEFASKVENNIKLDYLYLLTVADMRGTNNKIWNSWKDSLLKTLRRQTKQALQRGLSKPLNKSEIIQQTQSQAMVYFGTSDDSPAEILAAWKKIGDDYFLRYSPQEVARHSRLILNNNQQQKIVHIESNGISGGTDIFIKSPIQPNLFAITTRALDDLKLNVVEAKIISGKDNNAYNTYTVLELNNDIVCNKNRIKEIESALFEKIGKLDIELTQLKKKSNRRIECFAKPTEIHFSNNSDSHRSTMEIISTDRPGLLSKISYVLMTHNIDIRNAKITTLGAQVDDIFTIIDGTTKTCLNDEKQQAIKTNLIELLDF